MLLPHQGLMATAKLLLAETVQGEASRALLAELLSAVAKGYFEDAEGSAFQAFVECHGFDWQEATRWQEELLNQLHAMVVSASGGLVPSFRYSVRLVCQGPEAGLHIEATLPTLEDALERLHRTTQEDAYIPARYRR